MKTLFSPENFSENIYLSNRRYKKSEPAAGAAGF